MKIEKTKIIDYVELEFKRQVDFCKKYFKLVKWNPICSYTFAKHRKRSEAGRDANSNPFVSLVLHTFENPVFGFLEYSRYSKNKIIGSIVSTDWKVCVSSLMAHELAHAIQYTWHKPFHKKENSLHPLSEYGTAHGVLFQKIYTILRLNLINNMVDVDNIGVEPIILTELHDLSGSKFIHLTYGACTIATYNKRARKYPYQFVDSKGNFYKTSIEQFNKMAVLLEEE